MQAIKINAEHTESVRKDLLKGKCWQQSESACYFSDIMLSKFSFFSVNVYLLLFSVHEMRDGSMTVCLHSVGSDLTCTWELPELQQNVSMQSGQEAAAVDKDPRTPTSGRHCRRRIITWCTNFFGFSGFLVLHLQVGAFWYLQPGEGDKASARKPGQTSLGSQRELKPGQIRMNPVTKIGLKHKIPWDHCLLKLHLPFCVQDQDQQCFRGCG